MVKAKTMVYTYMWVSLAVQSGGWDYNHLML